MMIVCGTCGNFREHGSGQIETACIDCRTAMLGAAVLSQEAQEARARDREIGHDEARHERAAEWLREIGR